MATTRGVIKNKQTGAEIEGEVRHTTRTEYLFKIEGTKTGNWFDTEEWDFTAARPKLPTRPGYYTVASLGDTDAGEWRLFYLDSEGTWFEYLMMGEKRPSSEEIQNYLLDLPDRIRPVRLVCDATQPEGMFDA